MTTILANHLTLACLRLNDFTVAISESDRSILMRSKKRHSKRNSNDMLEVELNTLK